MLFHINSVYNLKVHYSMKIERLLKIDNDAVEAFKALVPQLTGDDRYPSHSDLSMIIDNEMTFLFVAKDNNLIVGSLTLVFYRIPTGLKGMIEDVVVDEKARGKGVATLLMNRAIDAAREQGAYKIELTSRPSRIAANKMYQRMGFELRETNFYRLDI